MEKTHKCCYVLSLKYSPGLAKEFLLLGNNLQRRGWNVKYILSCSYEWILRSYDIDVLYLTGGNSAQELIYDLAAFPNSYHKIRRLFRDVHPDLLLTYNTHPFNYPLTRLASTTAETGLRALYLHEPYVADKSSYGYIRASYIRLAEWLQSRTLAHTNQVILPSHHAQNLFNMGHPEYSGGIHMAPILLPDSQQKQNRSSDRRYFSFVGNINKSRSLNDFFELVNYAAAQDKSLQFKIVTRANISKDLVKIAPHARAQLVVVNKPHISDDEIADAVSGSLAIYLFHKQATQSGNIPIAFREGTPVIARDIPGLSQHVQTGRNGVLFSQEPTPAELYHATISVRESFSELSRRAREDFETIFAEHNWCKYYKWLME